MGNKGLVTNYEEGGYTTGAGGGACKVLPLQKGRTEKVLAMPKWGGGGHKLFWVGFYIVA